MAGLRIEVVAGTIEIHRQQEDGIEAVLLAIRLRLHQQHLLGQAIGRVGLFGVAVPQVLFPERHRRELGIGADRPKGDELLDAAEPGLLDQLHAHHQVLVEELARFGAVGPDPAHHGRQMNHDVRPHVLVHPRDIRRIDQVVSSIRGTWICRQPRWRRPSIT